MSQDLTPYEHAKHWVAQYESIDDVKKYLDEAVAVKEYARRANDYDMELMAARARVRAERRCGELLKKTEKSKGAAEPRGRAARPRLKDMGLTKDQSSKYQQLAEVPEDDFEEAVTAPATIPSGHAILTARQPKKTVKQIDRDALLFWGVLTDFKKDLLPRSAGKLVEKMNPSMQSDARQIAPLLQEWIKEV